MDFKDTFLGCFGQIIFVAVLAIVGSIIYDIEFFGLYALAVVAVFTILFLLYSYFKK
jgi:HJR/Mrr/RecB family endonuclease